MAVKDTKNTENNDFDEIEMVDINDSSLMDGVEQEIDTKEDWQARACPPPAGKYRLKLTTSDEKFQKGCKQGFDKADPNGVYYIKTVTCKIQSEDPKIKDAILDYKASTGVPRGKPMSSMAGILAMAGFANHLKPKMKDLELARLFQKAISQKEPILVAACDWTVWDTSDKNDMKQIFSGMKNFPKNAKGEPNHIVANKKGQEFVAKLKVIKWEPVKGGAIAPVAPPVAPVKPKPPVVQDIEDDGFEAVSSSAVDVDDDGEIIMD